jgi:hypothetical protein
MARDNLLKEALADARKIKEIAVENAKLQLEDQLKPQLSSMISESLRAQLAEDNDASSEIGSGTVTVKDPSPKMPSKKASSSSNIENPGQESEPMGDGDPQKAPLKERLAMGKGNPHKKPLKEFDTPVPGAQDDDDEFGLDGMDSFGGAQQGAPGAAPQGGMGAPAPQGGMGVPGGAPQGGMELDIAPDGQGGEEFDMDFGMGGQGGQGDELDLEAIIRELEADSQQPGQAPAMESFQDAQAGEEVDGAFDGSLKETLAGNSGDGIFHDGKAPKAVEGVNGGKKVSPGQSVTGTKAETMSEEIDLEEILREMEAEEGDVVESEQIATENVELKRSLREHREVIQYLRTKLHEVNMLNSKLLFTTKLFRAFNLNEGQKSKIVDTFDRAATLREVKLVYATLAESLYGNKSTQKKSATVVAEGLASKPIGSTKPKSETILEEGNTLVSRMQKLAGIKTQN